MQKLFRLVLMLFSLEALVGAHPAQQVVVPADLSELLSRAQEFRSLLSAGRLVQSMEFVLPEKRDLVLSAGRMLYQNPRVVGVDLTEDPKRVAVRVTLEMPAAVSGTVSQEWTAADPWVRVDGEWYFDAKGFDKVLTSGSPEVSGVDPEEIVREFADVFELLEDRFEIGTLTQTEIMEIPIPINYTGEAPIRFGTFLSSTFLDLTGSARRVPAGTDAIFLRVDSSDWEGPFDIPVPLDIEYRGVSFRRTVTVRGTVFAPLTLSRRQADPPSPDEFHFLIRNNSDREARISYVTVGGTLDILGHSDVIESKGEGFLHLKKREDVEPGNDLSIVLTESLHGRETYEFVMDLGGPF